MKNDKIVSSMESKQAQLTELRELKERVRSYLMSLNVNAMHPDFDLLRVYPETAKLDELVCQLDDLKRCLDSFRPLAPEQLRNLEEFWDTQYTYDSTGIEGNTLTLQETQLVLSKGITVKGKPLSEHLEVINHKAAFDKIKEAAKNKTSINEPFLLDVHDTVLEAINREEGGRYRTIRVRIAGSQHVCPNPLKVPDLMRDFFQFYEANKDTTHPALLAAEMHQRLVHIHPFVDGNGRTARLIMNLILLQNGFPIANISREASERDQYYEALELAHATGDVEPFKLLVAKEAKKSLLDYLNMVSTPQDDDKGGYFYQKISPYLP